MKQESINSYQFLYRISKTIGVAHGDRVKLIPLPPFADHVSQSRYHSKVRIVKDYTFLKVRPANIEGARWVFGLVCENNDCPTQTSYVFAAPYDYRRLPDGGPEGLPKKKPAHLPSVFFEPFSRNYSVLSTGADGRIELGAGELDFSLARVFGASGLDRLLESYARDNGYAPEGVIPVAREVQAVAADYQKLRNALRSA